MFLPALTPEQLPGFYNNADARLAKGYSSVLFRAGQPIHSNELNVIQENFLAQIKGVADGLYDNGDIVSGLVPAMVNGQSGNLHIEAGKIYLRGTVFDVGAATLTIPVDVKVSVGVRMLIETVTDIQDAILKDPAIGYDTFGTPGAATVKTSLVWGWQADGGEQDVEDPDGEFYPIYSIDRGNIILKDVPPAVSTIIDAIANYDHSAHGNYTIDGFKVRFARFEAALAGVRPNRYVFTISSGMVHVRGYQVGRKSDTPLEVEIDFDLAISENESETYVPIDGHYTLVPNRQPLNAVTAINGLVQITETLTKGASGTMDTLANSNVEYIIEVKKSATVYQSPRDYNLVDGKVDWSPSGVGAIEPTEADSYTVKYAVRQNLLTNGGGNIVSTGPAGIVLTGLIPHTTLTPSFVYVTYSYKLQRVDAITIDEDGDIHRIKGRPSLINPSAPTIPPTHTKLALVIYDWVNDPIVRDIRTPSTTFDEIIAMQERINDLYDLVAQQALKNDLTAREPADRRGQFVDPFLDNDFRDQAWTNTMAVLEGLLMLPIAGDAGPPNLYANSLSHHLLPYVNEIIAEQPIRTACSKINPYQAFEPIPARATISPSSDTWIIPASAWNTPIMTNFIRITTDKQQNATPSLANVDVLNVTTPMTVILGESIRPQLITFKVEGFGPGEHLNEIRFDGIRYNNGVTGLANFTLDMPVANAAGVITGSFTIPSGIPTGEKAVEFYGDSSYGDCTFIGMSQISLPTIIRNNTRSGKRSTKKKCDPLAETFTLGEDRILTGVDLKFCKVGSGSPIVYVQLRETTVGLPNATIVAEGIFDVRDLTLDVSGNPINVWTRILFEIPAHVVRDKEYAIVVMTDDANHSIATGGLGQYIVPQLNNGQAGFVTGQLFQAGEMLSSSNATTWTPHPKEDLTFRLLAARFTAPIATIDLGTFDAINISDLLMRGTVLRPSPDSDVQFKFTPSASPTTYQQKEEIPLALPVRLNGEVQVSAILTANTNINPNLSPILYPRPQVVRGNMSNSANYISRPFNARNPISLAITFKAVVVFEVLKRSGATVVPKIQSHVLDGGGTPTYTSGIANTEWLDMELYLERPLEGGWVEMEYRMPINGTAVAPNFITRVQLIANGTPAARVYVRKLRATTKS